MSCGAIRIDFSDPALGRRPASGAQGSWRNYES